MKCLGMPESRVTSQGEQPSRLLQLLKVLGGDALESDVGCVLVDDRLVKSLDLGEAVQDLLVVELRLSHSLVDFSLLDLDSLSELAASI
ncbi:hypothetical protein PC128_g5989 [Phytophthora cactorum]|uniref:Uncharacterized protein n=2 Tax=Phytophthora cactorum TaxID=29920 RepID=A0A8T1BD56_9STRA|nr:hypothetical protein PC115_g16179 [Phytophthora cactorum]KAG3006975.1 hypothetical protein PC120_g17066 [Phytophthora cactorum]KAG3144338.1 hypothetical protein C6341_g18757 [Phytophthora cactorum]KAG3198488.1 hypothetical protein PC128_g5989 [Phytophthora cactorum]